MPKANELVSIQRRCSPKGLTTFRILSTILLVLSAFALVPTSEAQSHCVICSPFECDEMGWMTIGNACYPPPCVNNPLSSGPGIFSGWFGKLIDKLGGPSHVPILPGSGCGGFPFGPGFSHDPNDKVGAPGVREVRFVSGQDSLGYAIFFENQSTATAPAQQVVVTDQLDLQRMDLSTFSLGPISFGSHTVVPSPGLNQFTSNLDLRPVQNLIVRIGVNLDKNSGLVTWHFMSIDPATLQLTQDPLAGFLPPNTTPPAGEGHIIFTVKQKPGLSSGTQIQNQASVVFDENPPILTPSWLNTIDTTPPISSVRALPANETSPTFLVQWSGEDVGSGISDFNVFVSQGRGPFKPLLLGSTATSATFTGQPGSTYSFFSIARDLVGNIEQKSVADTTTQIVPSSGDLTPPVTTAAVFPLPNVNGWDNSDVTITLSGTDNEVGGTGVKQITLAATGAQTIPTTMVSGSSTSVIVNKEGTTTVSFFGTDNAGNIEAAKTVTIKLDKTIPSLSFSVVGQSPRVVTISAQDSGSGVKDVTYSLDGVTYLPYTSSIKINSTNATKVFAAADDVAGNHATATLALPTILLGDLNGDGVVNCEDLAIVKAAFGKAAGQPGYDPRADVNGDGVVNILDLSLVARQLPAGTTCP